MVRRNCIGTARIHCIGSNDKVWLHKLENDDSDPCVDSQTATNVNDFYRFLILRPHIDLYRHCSNFLIFQEDRS